MTAKRKESKRILTFGGFMLLIILAFYIYLSFYQSSKGNVIRIFNDIIIGTGLRNTAIQRIPESLRTILKINEGFDFSLNFEPKIEINLYREQQMEYFKRSINWIQVFIPSV